MPEEHPILIVDDNEKNLFALSRLIEKFGHRTVCTNSGTGALQKLMIGEYGLILLDVQMPGLDGFETARLIKTREKTRDIPIIFFTAVHKEEEFVNFGFELGAVDYLAKPVNADLLKNKIKVFMRLRRQEQELNMLNSCLEERIADRTRALEEANQSLQAEISEHEKTEEKLSLLVQVLEAKNAQLAKVEETVSELNRDLERRVAERTAQLESTQKELLEKAHKAGMADIASGVLHNVGNILSSVITSAAILKQNLVASKLRSYGLANQLLKQNLHRIEVFIKSDPKGIQLLHHYIQLGGKLETERGKNLEDVDRILDKVDLIKDVVIAQQDYASGAFQWERLDLSHCVEEALKIQESVIRFHEIEVQKIYRPTPTVLVQRSKVLHILVNLLKNAQEAMLEKRMIVITVEKRNGCAYIEVTDSGKGIPLENSKLIFSHGFTTKATGNGFGLHTCATAMMEMGGNIRAESLGLNMGSSFILEFPYGNGDLDEKSEDK